MLFNSIQFLIFFPTVVVAYFLLPHRFRWMFLLAASYYFYMCWKPEYLLLILGSTIVDYFVGLKMEKAQTQTKRKFYLFISLFINLGVLFLFKYFNLFNESTRAVFEHFNLFYNIPAFKLLLPVGISFYTFQTLSYSIEVYRGHQKPEKHLGIFALYVAFFPQLVAGPIERSVRLLPQFYIKQNFDWERIHSGLVKMLWGFFKKVVVADNLAVLVNQVYNHPAEHNGITLILATYFFAFQIYCDFSGYSDIAIGTSRIFGIDLMKNFDRPYFAKSIGEFWKRWHISLSTWFRDYLYIPLGGNRCGFALWQLNIFLVFLISGLWHGANWTFVVWGALHGFYMLFAIWSKKIRNKFNVSLYSNKLSVFHNFIKIVITFHLVLFAWIFFRANTLADAFFIIENMVTSWDGFTNLTFSEMSKPKWFAVIYGLGALMSIHFIQEKVDLKQWLNKQNIIIRWCAYYIMFFSIIFLGNYGQNEFIYFQF